MTAIIVAILVVVFILVVLAPVAQDALPDEVEAPERVADWVGTLNYGTAPGAADAERRILSLGARVTPELFQPIARLQNAPQSLTADAQLRVEQLLVDFGLAGVMASATELADLGVQHSAYPSALRWLGNLGPVVMEPIFRAGARAEALYLIPLVARRFEAFAEYERQDGARLPETQRSALRRALALVWMSRNLGTPPGEGWAVLVRDLRETVAAEPAAPVRDAAERERLVAIVRSRAPHWQQHLAQVVSFAGDVAVECVVQTLRQRPEELTPAVLATAVDAGLPASRICAAMVEALRDAESSTLLRTQLARQLPISSLAPVAFASLGRNSDAKGIVALELVLAASGSLVGLVADALENDDASVRSGAMIVASRLLVSQALSGCVRRALVESDKVRGPSDVLVAVELFGAEAQRPLAEQWKALHGEPSPALERVRTLVSRLAERSKT